MHLFLPYLWGMETCLVGTPPFCCPGSYRTYEEWKPEYRFVRAWTYTCSYRTYEEWKQRYSIITHTYVSGSYRTYEEWKPVMHMNNKKAANAGSYRTYEEWKLFCCSISCGSTNGSYRTYEEWKPCWSVLLFLRLPVLTVPMRNGNLFLRLPC